MHQDFMHFPEFTKASPSTLRAATKRAREKEIADLGSRTAFE